MDIRNGNCLELLKTLPDKSVDLFLCDLPYGEIHCKWDIKIDMVEFWKEFKRVRKSKKTACIHFCSTKFGYELIKSWESGFKMDMVWKKRNKIGALSSRLRPMRNHEMVYFFYEQAPKYNRDKYHKRIQPKKEYKIEKLEEEEKDLYGAETKEQRKLRAKDNNFGYDPPNPASVLEEEEKVYGAETKEQRKLRAKDNNFRYDPPNPVSILEEDEYIEPAEDEPKSMYESTQVFIGGKRNHTTEKPLDILEFFLKYYTDENDVVCDPTMGSGSTGVACKKLKRQFIGFELDPKIFEVAKKRIEE